MSLQHEEQNDESNLPLRNEDQSVIESRIKKNIICMFIAVYFFLIYHHGKHHNHNIKSVH